MPSRRSLAARGHRAADGVEANARLTASTGGLLFVLLAAEGATILRVRGLLGAHVFLGMMLIPPVALKVGTTGYRFVRYYLADPEYRRKGPPPLVLRLIGPAVVVLTVLVLASGVALVLVPASSRQALLSLHRLSFVAWFIVTTLHVLGHIGDTARLAPLDWVRRPARAVTGTPGRRAALIASAVVGVGLGALLVGRVGPYLASTPHLGR
ncbi:MAG: hypothetical protein J2P59_01015 [Acidimicrobiales bacterium]|nr:hypothetical protein [Acidimicrobiales bacterium]